MEAVAHLGGRAVRAGGGPSCPVASSGLGARAARGAGELRAQSLPPCAAAGGRPRTADPAGAPQPSHCPDPAPARPARARPLRSERGRCRRPHSAHWLLPARPRPLAGHATPQSILEPARPRPRPRGPASQPQSLASCLSPAPALLQASPAPSLALSSAPDRPESRVLTLDPCPGGVPRRRAKPPRPDLRTADLHPSPETSISVLCWGAGHPGPGAARAQGGHGMRSPLALPPPPGGGRSGGVLCGTAGCNGGGGKGPGRAAGQNSILKRSNTAVCAEEGS